MYSRGGLDKYHAKYTHTQGRQNNSIILKYHLYVLQLQDTLSFLVTIKDRVTANGVDSKDDNLVEVPITVIVSDENDNAPEFQNVCDLLLL